ncbi:MAG: hypothetical protein ACRC35_01465 [Angustibacter sp.]
MTTQPSPAGSGHQGAPAGLGGLRRWLGAVLVLQASAAGAALVLWPATVRACDEATVRSFDGLASRRSELAGVSCGYVLNGQVLPVRYPTYPVAVALVLLAVSVAVTLVALRRTRAVRSSG